MRPLQWITFEKALSHDTIKSAEKPCVQHLAGVDLARYITPLEMKFAPPQRKSIFYSLKKPNQWFENESYTFSAFDRL